MLTNIQKLTEQGQTISSSPKSENHLRDPDVKKKETCFSLFRRRPGNNNSYRKTQWLQENKNMLVITLEKNLERTSFPKNSMVSIGRATQEPPAQ